MKSLFLFLSVLLPCSLLAAVPDYAAFRGTNEVVISTNPSTGKVIVGPTTPISQIASNAANAIVGASNGNYVRIQSGTDNNLWNTNAFYAVGSSNYYQQFKSTTTNTGGVLDQSAPWGMAQFSNNQQHGSDPHQDVQTIWGYNITGSGAVANTNEASFMLSLESDWQNIPQTIQTEWYLSYTFPYTNLTIRPFGINFQRSSNTIPDQVLANGDGNVNGNFILDNFNFYSPYSAQSGGIQIGTASPVGATGPATATMGVYGSILVYTNASNNGYIDMFGNPIIFHNKTRTKSNLIYTSYSGDGYGDSVDGDLVFNAQNSGNIQWVGFTKESLNANGSASFGGANLLARLTVTNNGATLAGRFDQEATTNAIAQFYNSGNLALSVDTNSLSLFPLTGKTGNLIRTLDTNGNTAFSVQSNGTLNLPLGASGSGLGAINFTGSAPAYVYSRSSGRIAFGKGADGDLFEGNEAGLTVQSPGTGVTLGINFASAITQFGDITLMRGKAGVLQQFNSSNLEKSQTNRIAGYVSNKDTVSGTNSHFIELAYDGALNTYRISANTNNTGILNATNQSLALGVGTNSDVIIKTNHTTYIAAQLSGTNAALSGTYMVDQNAYTNLNGTPATFTNLGVVTIPAGMLTNNGDRVVCRWEVDQQFTKVNTNEFKLVIGGNTVLDSGLQITSNGTVYVTCQLTRNTANSIRISGKEGGLDWNATIGRPFPTTNIIATSYALDTGTNNTIALQGSAQAVGAFTNRLTTAEYFPRP